LHYGDVRDYAIVIAFWFAVITLSAAEFRYCQPASRVRRKERWPVNLAFSALLAATAAVLPVSAIATAWWCEAHGVGLLNVLDAPFAVKIPVTILANSFLFFALHALSHKVPLLWRLHSVHHTDIFVDATTSTRAHPLEHVVAVSSASLGILLIGHSHSVLIFYYALEAVVVIYSHSQLLLPERIERLVSVVFITPRLHHIHHSACQPETDSNYGNVFTIWDRLLGTFRNDTCAGGPVSQFGLEDVNAETACDLDAQLMRPFTMRARSGPSWQAASRSKDAP
jgi:sterol desaturase/sphingolipid hydroxylase (fatty acid hydroxylase superfamily)